MIFSRSMRATLLGIVLAGAAAGSSVTLARQAGAMMHDGMQSSSQFQGPKANKGTVTASNKGGKIVLRLSDDFVVPDTPDPHWQVIDSDGNVYLLDKLKTKALVGESIKKEITVPKYIKNVSKVQIWCAYAEVNLGEATFNSPVM